MQQTLNDFNWDDGFTIPKQLLLDDNCDLALALEIFYLGDGFRYFQTFCHNLGGTEDWFKFISNLYDDIKDGKYKKSKYHYKIQLSKVQRYQLKKNNVEQIFIEDI